MRRVVITGMGLVTPLALGVEASWQKLISSESGIQKIEDFDTSDLPCKIAGTVPKGPKEENKFDPLDWISVKETRKYDQFIVFALAAASEAIQDSGFSPKNELESERTGVMIGSGIGGLNEIYNTSVNLYEKGPRRVSPFFIPSCLINMASGAVSIRYGFKGPNHSVVTACSTGAHAIGDAARIIAQGDADRMVAGGSESAIGRIGISGFCAARALSTSYNDTPTAASRPWDEGRDGFVMGEGAGIVFLEEYESAKKRGARIYGELIGYGMSGDAYHITAPAEDGQGAYRSMKAALNNAKLNPDDINYINAHGTSTPLGDKAEYGAVEKVFGSHDNISMSSTKSSIGHLLGAAGSVEFIFSLLAVHQQVAPPTLNLHSPSDEFVMDLVPLEAKKRKIKYALSNSFGFGGTNASLIVGSV